MSEKIGGGNKMQSYDPSTGRYGYPVDWDNTHKSGDTIPMLTVTQFTAIKTASNAIRDHLRDKEYEAVKMEAAGKMIIVKEYGRPWNHIDEVKKALRALEKSSKSITGSLQNPNLNIIIRKYLQTKLIKYKKIMLKFEEAIGGDKHDII